MVWLAHLCYTAHALAAVPRGAIATAGPPACTGLLASIEYALQNAGVRRPAVLTENLVRAELRTVEDVAELSEAEAAELFGELRSAAVPLGDRARLRKVAQGTGPWRAWPHGQSANTVAQPGNAPATE